MAKLDKLLGQAQEHLEADEDVLIAVQGAYETEKLAGYDFEVFPYENISSFEASKGMMGYKVSFFASGNKVKMKWIGKGDVPAFLDTVRSRTGKPSATSASSQETPSLDVSSEIRKLAALRDEGLLTGDEFQAKKAELLARL